MFKIYRIVFAIIALTISIFGLITSNHEYQPFAIILVSVTIMINGIIELKVKQKKFSFENPSIIVALFLFVVTIILFLSN
ncbi:MULTISPECIES: hypothetical protein [unclassified Bacillus (in: firmicutes)]|uniref:hypothetical protein n=1 Tax=unclassified Bacillus (in: firmicutes) TaxID=185979 RepID=UPI000BF23434|nr:MULTISPECIES: hypothetical protein [unclassified Bacillus (in: firmicutes)]PEJ54363.1 hypothetical protein CN692_19900 [Bacillus sp. AFS002410]PEL06755.1 hypothetical protein CN601_20730 [Bacillus sp. AFS017336]